MKKIILLIVISMIAVASVAFADCGCGAQVKKSCDCNAEQTASCKCGE